MAHPTPTRWAEATGLDANEPEGTSTSTRHLATVPYAAAELAVGSGEVAADDTLVSLLIGALLTQLQGAGMMPATTPGATLAPGDARGEAKPALSVAEAAELLGVSRALAYELVKRGELPSVRLGRRIVVPRRAVEQLLAVASEGRYLDANGAVLHREPPAVARSSR